MKCPMCNTGNLKKTGCHIDCDQCAFSEFNLTNEYIESAKVLLGEVMSNRVFNSLEDYHVFVERNIQVHLPQVLAYLDRVIVGRTVLVRIIAESVIDHAINLHIGTEEHNIKEDNTLVCKCGETDFEMENVGNLHCKSCHAGFRWDEEASMYVPKLLCKCGSITANKVDESGLSNCTECGKMYMYSVPHNRYLEV